MIRGVRVFDAKAIQQLSLLGIAEQGQLLGRSFVDIYDALRATLSKSRPKSLVSQPCRSVGQILPRSVPWR